MTLSSGRATSYFASADRAGTAELAALAAQTEANPIVRTVMESVEGFMMVLDEHRQVLAGNEELLAFLGGGADGAPIGLRPGEVLECQHAPEGPGGCGTSRACAKCGAVLAILAAQVRDQPVNGECALTFRHDGQVAAREFRVRATPLRLGELRLVILVLVDVSDTKRRDVLETQFMHEISDILQSLIAIQDACQSAVHYPQDIAKMLVEKTTRLKSEIRMQRLLLMAENGTYQPRLENLTVNVLFTSLLSRFRHHALGAKCSIIAHHEDSSEAIRSDEDLVLRILENMVTNAIEASQPGECVKIGFHLEDGCPCFQVRNPGVIAPDVALQIFRRYFTTKATQSSGLGTFSMKLFAENYLGGQVGFTSDAEEGTTFTLSLPG
jgi:signal transduction histidine kinase